MINRRRFPAPFGPEMEKSRRVDIRETFTATKSPKRFTRFSIWTQDSVFLRQHRGTLEPLTNVRSSGSNWPVFVYARESAFRTSDKDIFQRRRYSLVRERCYFQQVSTGVTFSFTNSDIRCRHGTRPLPVGAPKAAELHRMRKMR
jgi:hypothetical protein